MRLIEELSKNFRVISSPVAEAEQAAPADSGPGLGLAQTSTRPNIFGGMDTMRDGILVLSSRPNIFGGVEKTHDGQLVSSSHPNIFGGYDTSHYQGHGTGADNSALSDILGITEDSEN